MDEVLSRLILLGAVSAAAYGAGLLHRRPRRLPRKIDLRDIAPFVAPAIVEFTSPYCVDCLEAQPQLERAAAKAQAGLVILDVKERPDLFRKYRLQSTPTIVVVGPGGLVSGAWLGKPDPQELESALTSAL